MAADALMVLLLPVLMAYSLVGETAHELLGLAMFALFVCHHLLHRGWLKSVFRGKYTPARAVNTAVDLLLLAFMLAQPVSGVLMSKYILSGVTIPAGVTIPGAAAPARLLHLCLAYWGFVLLSVHLGLHLRVMLPKRLPKAASAASLAVMAWGVYAFVRRGFFDYLFLRTAFVFLDDSEPVVFFLLDYLAVMALIAGAAYWLRKPGKTER